MRLHRARKSAGLRVLRIEFPEESLQELIENGRLDWYKMDDPIYLARALGQIFSELLDDAF